MPTRKLVGSANMPSIESREQIDNVILFRAMHLAFPRQSREGLTTGNNNPGHIAVKKTSFQKYQFLGHARVVLRNHVPLFKLVKKFQLGYSLELFGAQLILVYVVKVFCACKLPPRREVPAAQSTAVRHANELALQALGASKCSERCHRVDEGSKRTAFSEREGRGRHEGSTAGSRE